MNSRYQPCFDNLNHEDVRVRLDSLRQLAEGIRKGEIEKPLRTNDVNNHIHTFYSFSPYSPSKAMWMAYQAGLATAGIMDHDSVSGASPIRGQDLAGEFPEAGRILGMGATVGAECRVDFSKTPLAGRRINNPDQKSVAYMAIHGIPHTQTGKIGRFFVPFSVERNMRNVRMTERINGRMSAYGITLDFERDVKSLSKYSEGGSITERHLLFALSHKLMEKFGKGQKLAAFLQNELKISIHSKIESRLLDTGNPFYDYDLLGVLKGSLLEMFYIDADRECPDVREVVALCKETGAIAAYAYLGDVSDSVTGDKKSQKFEDGYIGELFETIKTLGFNAVTYMPSRNTQEQLRKLKMLCEQYGFFQISGEDINSPRQEFVCKAMRNAEFKNLADSAWALIGHEKAATEDLRKGMFSKETLSRYPVLEERIQAYKELGCLGQGGNMQC